MPPSRAIYRPRVVHNLTALVLATLLAMGWLAAMPQVAHAGEDPLVGDLCLSDDECKNHYDTARSLSQVEQYEAALVEYQRAYARRPAPWLLINIGRMQQKMGRDEEAMVSFDRYLALDNQSADLRPRVQAYRMEVSQRLTDKQRQVRDAAADAAERKLAQQTPKEEPPRKVPIYKRWWFWTLVGGGVAVVATAVAVGVATQPREPTIPDGVMTLDVKF
ncbi:tetratricopeptide repeat protein [Haliangium sp. UPWRP_2]|uniref:tetratricopeptide repeat protein n=1 Tax=Haliangium sp. UPWRP_2 TaxID=1931276 RepID=UPI000B53B18C|nr:tetratricopeptide repeat protein [Haliangium sp. UPWRP_2]PSM31175.1 tetratricopeptide repeat protein [Haliangium sp. UPWRP_2]HNN94734.1 tetratricopeptide repeat protein [Pseudomonadota bacterium]